MIFGFIIPTKVNFNTQMAKVEIDIIKQVLKRSSLDERVIANILRDLQSVVQDTEVNDDEKKPIIKKQYVVLLADEEGKLVNEEWMGWIVQVPENEPLQSAVEKVVRVGKAFNLTKKGRKYPVKTVGEVCESVSGRISNEHKLWLKTKEPILVIPLKNSLDAYMGMDKKLSNKDEF